MALSDTELRDLSGGLRGRTYFITGSSRGIGLAAARLLYAAGARVLLHGRADSDALRAAAAELDAECHVADMGDDAALRAVAERVHERHGPLDGIVNNAGGGGWGSILDPDEEWRKSFEIDLMGAVRVCRYFMPAMARQGRGAVVNVASMWGLSHMAKPAIASYCCAKAALCKLTEVLAQQYAPDIRVNAVAPGWTETDMIHGMCDDDQLDFMRGNVLRERLASPEEIGQAIYFLLSDMSANMTGHIMPVDGGYLLRRRHAPGPG